jgi:hypothetical protein
MLKAPFNALARIISTGGNTGKPKAAEAEFQAHSRTPAIPVQVINLEAIYRKIKKPLD